MKTELVRLDGLLFTGCFDELAGQLGAFAQGHHPADDVTAEDVEDDVEVKIGPLGGAAQLGNVPTPKLIGRSGQQFRFLLLRMDEMIAALARCAIFFQDAIHSPNRAKIPAFIEQRGMDGGGRAILEAFAVEYGADGLEFVYRQRPSWSWASDEDRRRSRTPWPKLRTLPVEGSPSDSEHITGKLDPDRRREL